MPDARRKSGMSDSGGHGYRLDVCTVPLTPAPLALPTPLFARLEEKRVAELEALLTARVAEAERRAECVAASPDAPVTIEEFGRMELVVGRVLQAEPIKKSKKLLRLVVESERATNRKRDRWLLCRNVGRDVVVIATSPAVSSDRAAV
jgi:methionyl-tRNA synthetase